MSIFLLLLFFRRNTRSGVTAQKELGKRSRKNAEEQALEEAAALNAEIPFSSRNSRSSSSTTPVKESAKAKVSPAGEQARPPTPPPAAAVFPMSLMWAILFNLRLALASIMWNRSPSALVARAVIIRAVTFQYWNGTSPQAGAPGLAAVADLLGIEPSALRRRVKESSEEQANEKGGGIWNWVKYKVTKTRSDCVDLACAVEFWHSDAGSRASPDTRSVKRRRVGVKMYEVHPGRIQEATLNQLYAEFLLR